MSNTAALRSKATSARAKHISIVDESTKFNPHTDPDGWADWLARVHAASDAADKLQTQVNEAEAADRDVKMKAAHEERRQAAREKKIRK